DSVTLLGWQARQPQIAAPIHLTLVQGVLAVALSGDATIAHKGITDATKATSIGGGTFTLAKDNTRFRLDTKDETWKADAITGPLSFSAKSLGETVDLSAPAVSASAVRDANGLRWYINTSKLAFQNKARGVSATNALIKIAGAADGIAGEVRVSSFDSG